MKLVLKLSAAPGVIGELAYLLFDEGGELLPQQVGIVIDQHAGEMTKVTVTFTVDGENIRIEG